MTYNPEKHRRRLIRLKEYDYSQSGAYFITVCTYNRECLFGDVVNGKMRLNEWGTIVESIWLDLPKHYYNIELDAFIIMPNHVHGVVLIVGAGLKPAPTKVVKHHPLSEIVRGFKTFSSRRINEMRIVPGMPVWQRNYYEHVIRNENELDEIREYVIGNPNKWAEDENNPINLAVEAGLKPAPTEL